MGLPFTENPWLSLHTHFVWAAVCVVGIKHNIINQYNLFCYTFSVGDLVKYACLPNRPSPLLTVMKDQNNTDGSEEIWNDLEAITKETKCCLRWHNVGRGVLSCWKCYHDWVWMWVLAGRCSPLFPVSRTTTESTGPYRPTMTPKCRKQVRQ